MGDVEPGFVADREADAAPGKTLVESGPNERFESAVDLDVDELRLRCGEIGHGVMLHYGAQSGKRHQRKSSQCVMTNPLAVKYLCVMTSRALDLWSTNQPHGLQHRVSAVVSTLMAMTGTDQVTVAAWIDVKQSSLSLKLHNHRPWKLDEIEIIAERFGVEPEVFLKRASELLDSALRPAAQPGWGAPPSTSHGGSKATGRYAPCLAVAA